MTVAIVATDVTELNQSVVRGADNNQRPVLLNLLFLAVPVIAQIKVFSLTTACHASKVSPSQNRFHSDLPLSRHTSSQSPN